MILTIIVLGLVSPPADMQSGIFETPFVDGLLEGYQTYDAIAGIVMGGVIIISLNKDGLTTYAEKKKIIAKSGFVAILGLFIIYTGLIAIGALYNGEFSSDVTRTELLLGLSKSMLGDIGGTFVSVLVALACFTTAVAIVVSLADFFRDLFKGSKKAYVYVAIICCVMGVIMGSYDVGFIIDMAIPALMFIYPISIVLILLNVLPEKWASPFVFRVVVIVAFIFSIPDVLSFFMPKESLKPIVDLIPLANHNLGWVLPSLLVFIITAFIKSRKSF
jgi:LIVCS family branched-chain amino acid:cation transporter